MKLAVIACLVAMAAAAAIEAPAKLTQRPMSTLSKLNFS